MASLLMTNPLVISPMWTSLAQHIVNSSAPLGGTKVVNWPGRPVSNGTTVGTAVIPLELAR